MMIIAALGLAIAAHGTTLRWTPPTQADVEAAVAASAHRVHNYSPVGITRGQRPDARMPTRHALPLSRRRIKYTTVLGHGRSTYRRALRALRDLRMHDGSRSRGIGMAVAARGRRSLLGAEIVTWARSALGVYALNACRIVADESSRTHAVVAYGTLDGHWLAGEESMVVRIDPRTGCVTFSLLSLSRGSGALGFALFPLLGRMQRSFFAEQVHVMQRLAKPESSGCLLK